VATSTLPQKPFHRLDFGEGIAIQQGLSERRDPILLLINPCDNPLHHFDFVALLLQRDARWGMASERPVLGPVMDYVHRKMHSCKNYSAWKKQE
jgi:hypothetical protein